MRRDNWMLPRRNNQHCQTLSKSSWSKVTIIIGGLHLIDKSEDEVKEIVKELNELKIENAYVGHCTGWRAIATMGRVVKFKVEVLVLEPKPSLLNGESGNFRVFSLSKPFKVDSSSLLLDYLSWILWSFKAAVFSIPIFVREKPDLILSPNNTLPNILPAFLIKLLFRKPLYIVVHHFDITSHEKENFSLTKFVKNYRKIGYSFSASFFKALASILTISLLRKADKFISVSEFTARWLQKLGAKRRNIAGKRLSGAGYRRNRPRLLIT